MSDHELADAILSIVDERSTDGVNASVVGLTWIPLGLLASVYLPLLEQMREDGISEDALIDAAVKQAHASVRFAMYAIKRRNRNNSHSLAAAVADHAVLTAIHGLLEMPP